MNKARPKSYILYQIVTFSGDARCYIHCYPQQKWEYAMKGNNQVELTRKEISLIIPKEEFAKHWIIVD